MPDARLAPRRPDRSMALLADLARDAQDPAYAEAAARAAGGADRAAPAAGRRTVVAVAALALLGVVVGAAADGARTGAGSAARLRAQLVSEVGSRTGESDALQRQEVALRADVAARRDAALVQGALGRRQATALAELELAAGTQRVTGPGVVVVISDRPPDAASPALQARGGRPGDGRVADRDLQDLVNGLWAAGAEAVSVNDQRLTARTAIRSAGEAILVDLRPLSPPYTVSAIGGPNLQPEFTGGVAGRALAAYATLSGLRFEVAPAASLTLPVGVPPEPRAVRLPPAASPGGSG